MSKLEKIGIITVVVLIGVFVAVSVQGLRTPGTVTRVASVEAPTPIVQVAPKESICAGEAHAYRVAAGPLLTEWDDALELASNSPRISLSAPIAHLQSIRREAAKIVPGTCVNDVHVNILKSMDEINDGFLLFLGQQEDYRADSHFQKAGTYMDTAMSLLATAER